MGNIAASAGDVASFYFDLLTGSVVNQSSLAQMRNMTPLTTGFNPGMPYGLGLTEWFGGFPNKHEDYELVGHPGVDTASSCPLCGYNTKYKFGFATSLNSDTTNNCSNLADGGAQVLYGNIVSCAVYNAVVGEFSDGQAMPVSCGEMNTARPMASTRQRRAVASSAAQLCARSPKPLCPSDKPTQVVEYPIGVCTNVTDMLGVYGIVTGFSASFNISFYLDMGNPDASHCGGASAAHTAVAINECSFFEALGNSFLSAAIFDMVNHTAVGRIWPGGGIQSCDWHELNPLQPPRPEPWLFV
eukprot:NODE_1463_length_1136_cov_330.506938.p1 GENE.NODE_1463_length_1136_cov_330.506938~~NODE_1463_length_1136_cov_330.506938.p1  ORF type:complete len:300 (+),score=65.98 NODE_1463_length_1136_cov_330.506938:151-1050(+)